MNDKIWANESLRMALQNIQDVATKPLHVEIERLQRELAEAQDDVALLNEGIADAQEELGKCQQDALKLQDELVEARTQLSKWICIWCNHITRATGNPDADYAALQAHVLSCEASPLVKAQRELTEARSERNAWEDTASYHYAESCDNERKLTEAKELLRDARDRFSFVSDTLHDRIDAFLAEKEGER